MCSGERRLEILWDDGTMGRWDERESEKVARLDATKTRQPLIARPERTDGA